MDFEKKKNKFWKSSSKVVIVDAILSDLKEGE